MDGAYCHTSIKPLQRGVVEADLLHAGRSIPYLLYTGKKDGRAWCLFLHDNYVTVADSSWMVILGTSVSTQE